MSGRISQWSHPGLDFCLQGVFKITDSISLLVIGLFKLSVSSWFSVCGLYVSRNLPASRLSNLLAHSLFIVFCYGFCISEVLVVISPLSFLILFIWILFLFFLMNLAKRLLILFILSKNQLLISLMFYFPFDDFGFCCSWGKAW